MHVQPAERGIAVQHGQRRFGVQALLEGLVVVVDGDTRRAASPMSLSAQGMAALAARRSTAHAGE